jgi:asparagine synthase (glutamine-hydrolysing)
MCGLAGILRLDGGLADQALLRSMTDAIAHRGPDGDGFFSDGPVALGHRRLAIIDLVTGDQPMIGDGGLAAVVFNGEIYNFKELRGELRARGATFRTTSDTEVVLRAYEAWGVECLSRLRGMFAFAIWDRSRRRLFLARDRVGVKPLVYAWDGKRLLFASEIKALLQDSALSRDLDWEALRDYLTLHYIPSPRTIFRSVRKLPPASYLLLNLERAEPEIYRYWDLRFAPDPRPSEAEWREGLRWHLQDAVQSHLVSDVGIGAFLSGGMDSSTVVALMAQGSEGRIRTFSIGFDDSGFDELQHAREVARRYGTQHFEYIVKPDALESLSNLAWQFDEPFADSSALPTYHVCKITREHVTVALSGDGGDENFVGYTRYARAQRLHANLDMFPSVLMRPLWRLAGRLLPYGTRGQGYLEMLGSRPVDRYFRLVAYQRSEGLRRLLSSDARSHVEPVVEPSEFRRLAAAGKAPDYASTLQYVDVHSYLPEDILTKVDRTSMAVSLEARVPFLDHVLMEYVATMPTGVKFSEGGGKVILKRAMASDLPAGILERPKMGFAVPLASWFRRELTDYVREILTGRRTCERGLVDPAAVSELLAEHESGRHDRSARLWAILCLEQWARRWLDR